MIFGAAVLPGGRPSRTMESRVEAAFRCGGPEARYMPTGAVGRHGASEASLMGAMLQDRGVPAAHIRLEETGTDTLSSAVACARLLAHAPGPVRVASSGYHLPRCRMLLWLAGVRATSCPPPRAGGRRWYWRAREGAALPYDAVAMGFRLLRGPRPSRH